MATYHEIILAVKLLLVLDRRHISIGGRRYSMATALDRISHKMIVRGDGEKSRWYKISTKNGMLEVMQLPVREEY
jgi:hypothetical protein